MFIVVLIIFIWIQIKKDQKEKVEKGKLLINGEKSPERGVDEEAKKPSEPGTPTPFLAHMISNDAIDKQGLMRDDLLDESQHSLNGLNISQAIQ